MEANKIQVIDDQGNEKEFEVFVVALVIILHGLQW